MTAIEFSQVSKQYRLGLVSTGTLAQDLNRFWQMKVLGREDPYLKIGEANDRASRGTSEYVWALRNIDLKVEEGDVVGIIGRNGAGKSTLLKLLSRVTSPTTGTIRARGRIASLLEVGTGFHPEMTGRENIYMNGCVLGMSRTEIDRKLDEIVDFSGCERYIDTPVKRYSSGMTVRLGFAIAAHLDPEILVVDEVLAVGDAEFQKKAIGKMQDVANGQGRTVLFVSHNMGAVRRLCKTGILLNNGEIEFSGTANECIDRYVGDHIEEFVAHRVIGDGDRVSELGSGEIVFREVSLLNDPDGVATDDPIVIEAELERRFGCAKRMNIQVFIHDEQMAHAVSFVTEFIGVPTDRKVFKLRIRMENHGLTERKYKLGMLVGNWDMGAEVYNFDYLPAGVLSFGVKYVSRKSGAVYADGHWDRRWGAVMHTARNSEVEVIG